MPGPRRSKAKAKERKVTQAAQQMDRRIERRGGARANAGRPPGTKTVVKRLQSIRQVTEDIVRDGKLPLRLMIKNMCFYDEKATYIEEQFHDAMADNVKRFSEKGFLRALELFTQLGDMRMKGQKCAVDAAPFLHPRLSAIEMQVHHSEKPKDLPADDEAQHFRDDFRKLRTVPVIAQDDVEVEDAGE